MTKRTLRIFVPNGLLFLLDPEKDEPFEINGRRKYWSTPYCVAVACQPDSEGVTAVTIGRPADVRMEDEPIFDRVLKTPSRSLVLELVPRQEVFRTSVAGDTTPVRIWTNRAVCPDDIVIAVG